MNLHDVLWKLEGLHTVETVMDELHLKKQSALNLLSRLTKEGHVTISGGGRKKRVYNITLTKQRLRVHGMWDVLNAYNPSFKLRPWYDHQVHGVYSVEEALVDAVHMKSFRISLAALRLFQHVKNWKKLHDLAMAAGCMQQIGALYNVARIFLKVRTMPKKYKTHTYQQWQLLSHLKKKNFSPISTYWRVYIPFNENDIREVLS